MCRFPRCAGTSGASTSGSGTGGPGGAGAGAAWCSALARARSWLGTLGVLDTLGGASLAGAGRGEGSWAEVQHPAALASAGLLGRSVPLKRPGSGVGVEKKKCCP